MKRECGKGELIPTRYTMKYYLGLADRETTKPATGPNDPAFDEIIKQLNPCGDVRLYAYDAQGYANCIRAVFRTKEGAIIYDTDRRDEL